MCKALLSYHAFIQIYRNNKLKISRDLSHNTTPL